MIPARQGRRAHPGHTWGQEYFDAVERAGLCDVTYGLWHEERPTRFHATHRHYQDDFVLASHDVATRITTAHVDSAWTEESFDLTTSSDHAPVWFQIGTTP